MPDALFQSLSASDRRGGYSCQIAAQPASIACLDTAGRKETYL